MKKPYSLFYPSWCARSIIPLQYVTRNCANIVTPQALFSRKSVTSAEKKQRKYLLLEIGRHIRSVIQEKRDEGGDYEWWRAELWKFVVDATPKKNHNYTIQQYEDLYEKFEMQESGSGGNDGTAVASGSGKMDLKVKGEPEEAVDYMSVDVKPKLESGVRTYSVRIDFELTLGW